MVFAFLAVGLVIATLLVFRDQIKAFADDLQNPDEKSQEDIDQDERGAIENTQRFIFGEETIDKLKAQNEANALAVDKFIKDSQTNIDQAIAGVNTNLVTAQNNLETFANESKANIGNTINTIKTGIDTGIKGTQESIDKSISDTQGNIDQFVTDSQTNLDNIFNTIFGGQQAPKAVTQKTPAPNTTAPKVTISPTSTAPDLSFLTPNTSFTPTIQPKIEEETEVKATTSRTSRATRFS